MDPDVDYSVLVAKRNGPRWLRAKTEAGLLEQAVKGHYQRYGPAPPEAATWEAGKRGVVAHRTRIPEGLPGPPDRAEIAQTSTTHHSRCARCRRAHSEEQR